VGLEVPERLRAKVGKKVGSLRRRFPAARWVPAQNYHLTLVFLGETEEREVDLLRPAVAEACRRHRPFTLQVSEAGVFPPQGPARVLWLGMRHDASILQLQSRVAEAVAESLQAEISSRRSDPHLTIARCSMPWQAASVSSWLGSFPPHTGEEFTVRRGALFRSLQGTGGVRYRVLETYPFGGQE